MKNLFSMFVLNRSHSHSHSHSHNCLHSPTMLESSTRVVTLYTIMHALIHIVPLIPLFLGLSSLAIHAHSHDHATITSLGELLTEVVFLNFALHILMFILIVISERMRVQN